VVLDLEIQQRFCFLLLEEHPNVCGVTVSIRLYMVFWGEKRREKRREKDLSAQKLRI